MWFFKRKEPTKALRQLQDDFAELRRDVDNLQLSWSEVYGKIRTTMGRITKSAAILEAGHQAAERDGDAAPAEPPLSATRPEVVAALEEIAKRRGYRRVG